MKKLLFISAILMAISSVCVKAQSNQPILNQVELSKKLTGAWQDQSTKDTVNGFEMTFYKNAVLETMYRTINGAKELLGTISYTYDPKFDKFKGFWIHSTGQLDSYYFKFSSDKEVVFERVENFESNKFLARNSFIFPNQDHLNGTHYNRNGIQYRTSKWVKTKPDGVKQAEINSTRPETKTPSLNQLELAKKLIGVWQVEGKKDSIRGIEFEQYGNTIIASDILITNGKKVANDKISIGFSKSENMFKMFFLFPSGNYGTRNAYFTSENRFVQEFVQNFNPEKLTGTAEFIFDSPTMMTARVINLSGKITTEGKLTKVQ